MVLQDFVFLGVPTKCLQFQIKALCHGGGREFESRGRRHISNALSRAGTSSGWSDPSRSALLTSS